ncbi:MAG: DUF1461 domain-containing protein [Clostridia bacterium]|nr:DUF1461 domain-containing protein [Clostridia bacterium]
MKRTLYALGAALCALLALIVIACAAVTRMGRDGALYARCFHAYAQTEHLGVGEEAYDGIADDLASYFSGGDVEFPYFSGKEQTHLADIRALFSLFDRAWLLLIPAVLLAFLLLRRPDPKGFFIGCGAAILLLLALGGWCALDFNGAFTALHHLLFTNDFWLLNPRTDLLICLMPERMFTALGLRLGLTALPAWLLVITALGALCARRRKA